MKYHYFAITIKKNFKIRICVSDKFIVVLICTGVNYYMT
jgi:hypothetical protein